MEHDDDPARRPSTNGASHPRPQLQRDGLADLSGTWRFEVDDAGTGVARGLHRTGALAGGIVVPFPPESAASGIGDTAPHRVFWYARTFGAAELEAAGRSASAPRLLLRFGAVDHRARVWVDGSEVGGHEGGHTPFALEVQHALLDTDEHLVVVRVEDDPLDVAQPRGKQDWRDEAHSIWYDRTSGIWQPVWLEATPELAIEGLQWRPEVTTASVHLELTLNRPAEPGTRCRVVVTADGRELAATEFRVARDHAQATITLAGQENGQAYEELLWSPESPTLLDATVTLLGPAADEVRSYFGLVSAAVDAGLFLLNDRPYFVRSVLEQGFWPQSHLAAPSPDALRDEVELIRSLGFNAVRVHQKIEDPRFLYWADRLGLLVWGEAPGAFEFSATAVRRSTAEWIEAVERDRSHPSIVTWVPMNESWGVQHLAHDPAQRAYAAGVANLTRALDPSRPVISNDGWEHVDSDIVSIHDYEADPGVLAERYGAGADVAALTSGVGPAGRRIFVGTAAYRGQPIMLTEFGGVRFTPGDDAAAATWGYSTATTADEFAAHLRGLFAAVQPGGVLAGFCYTQLTDTMQEANGLVTANRVPKLAVAAIRAMVRGERTP